MALYDNGNDIEVAPFGTHTMAWERHSSDSSLANAIGYVFKNGNLVAQLAYPNITNLKVNGISTAYFNNDGEEGSHWSLLIVGLISGHRYQENWIVRTPSEDMLVKNIQYIRSHIDSDGGFIGNAKR